MSDRRVIARGLVVPAGQLTFEQSERAVGAGLSFDELVRLVVARDGYAGEWWGLAQARDVSGFRAYAHVPPDRSLLASVVGGSPGHSPVVGVVLVADVPGVEGAVWDPESQKARAESLLGSSYLPPGTAVTLREVQYNAGDRWRSARGTRVVAASKPLDGTQQADWRFVDRRVAPVIDVEADQSAQRILLEVRQSVHRAVEFAQVDPDRSRQWAATARSQAAEVVLDVAVQPSTRDKARLLVDEAIGLEAAAAERMDDVARSRVRSDFPQAAATALSQPRRDGGLAPSTRSVGSRRTRSVIDR